MATGITTTSLLPAPVQQSFSEKLLAVKTPNLIHKIPAMSKQLMRNGGRTIRFRRYNKLPTAPIPVGNSGAPIAPTPLSSVDIDATMSFYAQVVAINEQVN